MNIVFAHVHKISYSLVWERESPIRGPILESTLAIGHAGIPKVWSLIFMSRRYFPKWRGYNLKFCHKEWLVISVSLHALNYQCTEIVDVFVAKKWDIVLKIGTRHAAIPHQILSIFINKTEVPGTQAETRSEWWVGGRLNHTIRMSEWKTRRDQLMSIDNQPGVSSEGLGLIKFFLVNTNSIPKWDRCYVCWLVPPLSHGFTMCFGQAACISVSAIKWL